MLAESYDGVSDLSCSREPHWYLCSVLPLETMLRSMAHADTRDHVDIRGSCFWQTPCGSPWIVLLMTNYKGQKKLLLPWYWWFQTPNWERDIKGFCDNPQPIPHLQNNNNLDRKPRKRILKHLIRTLKYSSPKLRSLAALWVGGGFSFLKGTGSWEFDHTPLGI